MNELDAAQGGDHDPTGDSNKPGRSETARLYLAVALGSTAGGLLRWLVGEGFHELGLSSIWGILFANGTGSFVIGLYAALTGPNGRLRAGPAQRLCVMTGFCGGYTTFSAFSLETVRLYASGAETMALIHIGLSIVTWLAAVAFGFRLGRRFNRA